MDLAKRFIDVGLFTNSLDEMRAFYGDRLGLKFEEMLPLGAGSRQYRYGLLGSVLKINSSRDPVASAPPVGYRKITIADPRTPMPIAVADPDGTPLELVPAGQRSIKQIEIHLAVTDPDAFARFYGEALGGEMIEPGRYRLGETIVSFAHDSSAIRAEKSAPTTAAEALAAMRAVGFRYITIQVRDCNVEHRRLMSLGVWEGSAPMTLGEVARISFIRDPDGNFIEISQRASLTGPLPKS
jgi:catechol 2,3-dioxygenase-like lactoylglutathione lyase family enzyme